MWSWPSGQILPPYITSGSSKYVLGAKKTCSVFKIQLFLLPLFLHFGWLSASGLLRDYGSVNVPSWTSKKRQSDTKLCASLAFLCLLEGNTSMSHYHKQAFRALILKFVLASWEKVENKKTILRKSGESRVAVRFDILKHRALHLTWHGGWWKPRTSAATISKCTPTQRDRVHRNICMSLPSHCITTWQLVHPF